MLLYGRLTIWCLCSCAYQQSDAILFWALRACVCVSVCFSDGSPHGEGGTLSAAAAPLHDTEALFFSSFHLSTPFLSLFFPLFSLYISISHPISSLRHRFFFITLLSPLFPPLYRWLHLYAAGFLSFFLYFSLSHCLSLSTLFLSHPLCFPGLSALFESISHHLSVTISVSSITLSCSSHSSSHFHSSLLPPQPHHCLSLSQISSPGLSPSLKQRWAGSLAYDNCSADTSPLLFVLHGLSLKPATLTLLHGVAE